MKENFDAYMKKRLNDAWVESFEDLRNKKDMKSLDEKIDKTWEKFNGTHPYVSNKEAYRNNVLKKISENDFETMRLYAKDPAKKTFHEAVQREYCASTYSYIFGNGIYKPSPSGNKALYNVSGEVKTGLELKGEDRKLFKSIDMVLPYHFGGETFTFYAYQKYTAETGGSQNNQLGDVIIYSEEGSKSTAKNIAFIDIVDGLYWDERYTKWGHEFNGSKIDYLNEVYGNGHEIACHSEDLDALVIPRLITWLKGFNTIEANKEIERLLSYGK